jgi:cytochrome c oxidase assembly factor CtaG
VAIGSWAALAWYLGAYRLAPRAGWFFAGIVLLALTLLSPLNLLAQGCLFSAHMAQHIVLLLLVPGLLLLGLPARAARPGRRRGVLVPAAGWLGGMGAMWFWHVPVLCNAAANSPMVHGLQTVSLLALGCLFWWPILSPTETDRLFPPAAVVYLGGACFACSLLGIIITLSPVPVCSIFTMPRPDDAAITQMIQLRWGLTPEKDQQIGGLLMWVPMCLVYFAAILAQVARWFAEPAIAVKEQT